MRWFFTLIVLMIGLAFVIAILAADPPVLPTKPIPAKLGSKDNPIECLYVRKLVVLGAEGEERIKLQTNPDSAVMVLEVRESAMSMSAHKNGSMLLISGPGPAFLSLVAGGGKTITGGINYSSGNQYAAWPPR